MSGEMCAVQNNLFLEINPRVPLLLYWRFDVSRVQGVAAMVADIADRQHRSGILKDGRPAVDAIRHS